MTTIQAVELGVLGPLQARRNGNPVTIPGAKPRAILTMLGLYGGSVVSADALTDLLWGDDPPRTAAKALQTHISALRRVLGDGFVVTEGLGWMLSTTAVDAPRYKQAAKRGRAAAAAGDTTQAVVCFEEAMALWRGTPELPDSRRGISEKTRWIEGHAALVEDRADALLAAGRAAEIVGELEAAVADAPLRERRWAQLMLALYRAGRQGEALGAYQRVRSLLADELGVDPGPELRRLEAAVVTQDSALDYPGTQHLPSVTRAVTFLLTDIEGSTAAWEADAGAMAVALARHDELIEQIVTSRGGRLIKTRGEGDATFSVFERPSAAAAAALELQDAFLHEPWALSGPMRVRAALHTGEVELRDGDYFGRAVNRVARLRSLAAGGQILCSGATAELVIDTLPDDVVLADLGMRQLRNLPRPEHVFELRVQIAERPEETRDTPLERPGLPEVLTGPGPFVGRGRELERLASAWQTGGVHAVLIAGEPGVGKTRLAGEWSRQAYGQGAVVLYGRSDEDLGAPYQPFAEALRSLMPCIDAMRLRGVRGVEALLSLVPGLTDALPDLCAPARADPDTERYALFDAVVAVLELASTDAPLVLVLDDLHWAAKPTLLLLRHLLRFGDHTRVQVVATYRSTDLDRSHPLAAMLADLHRDGTASRLALSGLDEEDVTAYLAEAGYDDEELARALASVTGGNPFFLIEALRHVDESGGAWDPSTLPQGVREAVSRRLSRLSTDTNNALAAAAVIGSRFALNLVEHVVDQDLVDAFDEACKAGIVVEEPGGRYRFNHAIVRQSLLAELSSVRRMRLHQRIAATLETGPGEDDELLAELAHHYFECAWAGNAAKAVDYCRRAADQAMARLAYEGAADLYDRALHALEEIDDDLPDRVDQVAELLVARCEALLAAGDVTSASGAVSQLHAATVDSSRLAAWATCFDGQLSMLTHPERLDEVEAALGAAADSLAGLGDAAGEAKAHTVRAGCLARLGRIGDCEIALDKALTAARHAGEHRRVNAVLAGAPVAALWGPNPVPRAGGRCLDVVRLLRITTDSPAVEATSTRCQAVLEAFRGRAPAARRMIDSARRTVTELGLRHALLEVEQFAGIVELVVDAPGQAEPHLRRAYRGFRRMGLDADTAETAALLGRACLALDRDPEADELCSESERLAGHALKASISWRTLRALLLARRGDHDGARRMAENAVALAEQTDGLVDHGDACLVLATVLDAAEDSAGARIAAEQAVDLYERKGAVALAEKARRMLGERTASPAAAAPEAPAVALDNAAVRVGEHVVAATNRGDWDEFEQLYAPGSSLESRRKIVGFTPSDISFSDWQRRNRTILETGEVQINYVFVAVRGERLALSRVSVGTADASPGAPNDEFLDVYGIDEEGRIAWQIWFDVDDIDAALAELDAAHARFEDEDSPERRLENTAARVIKRFYPQFAARDWAAIAQAAADNYVMDDRRQTVNIGIRHGRDAGIKELQATADVGFAMTMLGTVATRGERLVLTHVRASGRDPGSIQNEALNIVEIDGDEKVVAAVVFDVDDFDAALAELDTRYLAGEAAAYAHAWSVITGAYAAISRREFPALTPDCVTIDHRRAAAYAPGELPAYIRAGWDLDQSLRIYVEVVHRLSDLGAVCTYTAHGVSREGFDAEWRDIALTTVDGDKVGRCEMFDAADLDAAIARFDELSRPAPRLQNAASRAEARFEESFAARHWDAMTELMADDIATDDRRRLVGIGVRSGMDTVIADWRATADIGVENVMSTVIATRGARLVLSRYRFCGHDPRPESFRTDVLGVLEIDSNQRITSGVMFDIDDTDAAIAELDARYLAGEAAPHAQTWSALTGVLARFNGHEISATTPDWVSIDHRRGIACAPGEMIPYLRTAWDVVPDAHIYVEAVHRLSDLGAVVTDTAKGTSQEGFDGEWREVAIAAFDGDRVNRWEMFDEADIDAAIARFEELHPQPRQLENAASQLYERFKVCFAARDWHAITDMLADNVSTEDRRRVVNTGLRQGPHAVIAEVSGLVEVVKAITSEVIATRGARLVLTRTRTEGYEAFITDLLDVIEIDADGRALAHVVFEPDDIDGAFEELDSRYLAGEAAANARTWSAIARATAGFNRQVPLPTTTDPVYLDHRPLVSIEGVDLAASVRAVWDITSASSVYNEAVHRLDALGAVLTQVLKATTKEGLDVEVRMILLLTIEGDLYSRVEAFDETDLDAAIARFDELSRPTPRLKNAASRMYVRFNACLAARDWDAMAEMLADDICDDDRRRVVSGGITRGRDAQMANLRAIVDVGVKNIEPFVIATRGERLALSRARVSGGEQYPEAFGLELLTIVEIDTDKRIAAGASFDLDDIDAAFAELDARYLAGEAADYSRTWSVITSGYAAFNRREFHAPDWVSIDHRRARAFAPGELTEYMHATWDLAPNISGYVEAVHRLSNLGAVITHVMRGTSQEGFDAEWRDAVLFTVDGDLFDRCELFDESDLDAAIARFELLSRSALRPENIATRVSERLYSDIAARDWQAVAQTTAENVSVDDRRRVVNAGSLHGRDANIKDTQATVDVGFTMTMVGALATRGARLALTRVRVSGQDPEAIQNDALSIVEIDADERIVADIVLDLDDIDAAFEELDARYLAGEAAEHARTWSLVAGGFAAINRHELPDLKPNWVNIDHRRGAAFATGDMTTYIHDLWEDAPDINVRIAVVHRLSNFGAVVTAAAHGTSRQGFDAEWREVILCTFDGNLITRCELFDDADIDAAIARFEELHPQPPRLENTASQRRERLVASFAARDWDAMSELLDDNISTEDRRRVVNAGLRQGRDAAIEELQAIAATGTKYFTSAVIAMRGEHLVLSREQASGNDPRPEAFRTTVLDVIEIDPGARIVARVIFDPDDIDAAIEELDARYLAGEAATHAHTWSVVSGAYAGFNQRDLDTTTPDWVNIDHRRGAAFAPGDMIAYIQAAWDDSPDTRIYISAVHRLSDIGAVVTHVAQGISHEGFDAEWRDLNVLTVDGDLVNRSELFDETDLDAALARFDELTAPD